MKSIIPKYDTYDEAVEDLSNLQIGTVISVDETMRLYRVEDGAEITLKPLTGWAGFELNGTTLTITY